MTEQNAERAVAPPLCASRLAPVLSTLRRLRLDQNTAAMALRAVGLLLGAAVTAGFARLLQPEKFGVFSFILAVLALLSIPQINGLRATLVRGLAYAQAEDNRSEMAALWSWVATRAFVATVIIAACAGLGIWVGSADADFTWHLVLALGLYLLLPAPHLLSGIVQGLGRPFDSHLPEFLLRPLASLVLMLAVWLWMPPHTITVATALAIFAAAVVADLAASLYLAGRRAPFSVLPGKAPSASLPKGLALSSLSFGAIASVYLVNSNLDVFMLGLLRGGSETGLYKAASVLAGLAAFGLSIVNAVILPQIARYHAAGDKAALQATISKAARIIAVFTMAGAVVLVVFGASLLAAVFDESYRQGHLALVILTIGQVINGFFGPVAVVLNMTGHERVTLICMILAVIFNGALNLALVPRFGIEGAALATTLSMIFWNVALAVMVKRRTGYRSTIFRR